MKTVTHLLNSTESSIATGKWFTGKRSSRATLYLLDRGRWF